MTLARRPAGTEKPRSARRKAPVRDGADKSTRPAIAQPTPVQERRQWLSQLFPEAFADGRFDATRISLAVGEPVVSQPDRYVFSWAGKRAALRLLQMPSRATLAPQEERSVHFDESRNVFVEGDNLETLKLLYKPYFGKIQTIYIDPPYNTGDDHIYPDNYSDPLEPYLVMTGQATQTGDLLTSNPETAGRFHSAWLSMMYPRLFMMRQLLGLSGTVWISIDDTEFPNLRLICNEIFGEENWIATFIWEKRTTRENRRVFSFNHDYVLCYARDKDQFQAARKLLPLSEKVLGRYKNVDNDPRGDWQSVSLNVQAGHATAEQFYTVTTPNGRKVSPPAGRAWSVVTAKMNELREDNRVWFGEHGNNIPRLKLFLSEAREGLTPHTLWKASEVGTNDSAKKALIDLFDGVSVSDTPKPVELIKRILQISSSGDDLVADFFAGAGTTAQAVLELNREDGGRRSLIAVELPEETPEASDARKAGYSTTAAVAEERVRRVLKKLTHESEHRPRLDVSTESEDLGLRVFKLQPSAFKLWSGTKSKDESAYIDQMALFEDRLVAKWKVRDVLWEVALREGLSLGTRIERVASVKTNAVWRVADSAKGQAFTACLDDEIQRGTVAALDLMSDDVFVCRDTALTDELAANLALQCRLQTI